MTYDYSERRLWKIDKNVFAKIKRSENLCDSGHTLRDDIQGIKCEETDWINRYFILVTFYENVNRPWVSTKECDFLMTSLT